MKINTILKRPLITEKSTQLAAKQVYAFEVSGDANKHQIAQAVTSLYGVKVGTVRVITRKGKEKRIGRRMIAKQMPDFKVAYIQLTEGSLDLFPKN